MVQIILKVHTEYLQRKSSDHRPVLTRFVNSNQKQRGRFYFDKQWCQKQEVVDVVKRGWPRHHLLEDRSISARILDCRKELSSWKRQTNTNSKKRIQQLRTELDIESLKLKPDMIKMSEIR